MYPAASPGMLQVILLIDAFLGKCSVAHDMRLLEYRERRIHLALRFVR